MPRIEGNIKYKGQAVKDKRRRTVVGKLIRVAIASNIKFTLILFLSACLTVLFNAEIASVFAYIPATSFIAPSQARQTVIASAPDLALLEEGKKFYEIGKFTQAVNAFQQAAEAFKSSGDVLRQASAFSNLSLAYQQLGQWTEAKEAIASSLQLINQQNKSPESLPVLAQALNTQGSLQLALAQPDKALVTWQQAASTYAQVKNEAGKNRALINQAQALEAMGLYRRALETLQQVVQNLQSAPDSSLKIAGLRSLGNSLRLVGDLEESVKVLQQSLEVAKRLQSPQDISDTLLSLANTSRAQQNTEAALAYYQQAANTPSAATKSKALLNQFSLLVETHQQQAALALLPQIQSQLANLPPSKAAIEGRINLVQSLIKLGAATTGELPTTQEMAQLLAVAAQQSKSLGDQRAESYALGSLGGLYEQNQQIRDAMNLTQQALLLAQSMNASDITYRWQWQMGRLLKAEGDIKGAIAAYSEAVKLLKALRSDLVAINTDLQFTFKESVEPIYREFVALLLQPSENSGEFKQANGQKSEDTIQKNLAEARNVIESLQLAELDNFFQEACLQAKAHQIDQIDNKAAVIYPIILKDRLEVILSLPQKALSHYATKLPADRVEGIVDEFKQSLTPLATPQKRLRLSQQIYEWLIRPAANDLASSGIKTLVFVLDGSLRNVPMAALYDGKQYLVQQYSIAISPGLQLLEPRPLIQGKFQVLKGGLSEARQGFSALPAVESELKQISSEVPGKTLLNQDLTYINVQNQLKATPFPIVHLATHGQFSSNAKETFILSWDGPINVKQLDKLFRARGISDSTPLELLVLSACQTASGDNRAALGLAGVAVRSGARSTLATLWSVKDEATAALMTQFYRELSQPGVTKAEALQRSQLSLLRDRRFQNPLYWAPFVLVGNWR